jgi:hypothetical protein
MTGPRPVTTIEPMMRRRAANAVLSTAAALARLADEIDEARASGDRALAELQRQSDELREEYLAALSRYRAVMGAA